MTPPENLQPGANGGLVSSATPRWLRVRRTLVLFILIPYLTLVSMITAFQRSLIFVPTREQELAPHHSGFPDGQVHEVNVTTNDGLVLNGWHVLAAGHTARDAADCQRELGRGRPLVLFFSGNGGHRGWRAADFQALNSLGVDILAFDYRGYGDNPGSPSEEAIAHDARAIWRYATLERQVEPERILLYGESLGGAVATRLAAEVCDCRSRPAGLILRSTFSSMVDAGSYHYPWLPVRWLLVDRFPSVERITRVTCPILMLHGRRDRVVPFELGSRLFQAAPHASANAIPKRLIELPAADHNNVLQTEGKAFQEAVQAFVREVIRAEGLRAFSPEKPVSGVGTSHARQPVQNQMAEAASAGR